MPRILYLMSEGRRVFLKRKSRIGIEDGEEGRLSYGLLARFGRSE